MASELSYKCCMAKEEPNSESKFGINVEKILLSYLGL
jgi:hypothetical protein